MQYSIMGKLNTNGNEVITGVINKYRVLDKENLRESIKENGKPQFSFELKTSNSSKKHGLFQEFKQLVDQYTGEVSWHECAHGEDNIQPCVIAEKYEVGE